MNKYLYRTFIFGSLFALFACQKETPNEYFNGDIKIVECFKEQNLKGTLVELDDAYAHGMLVYDSLLIGGSGENTFALNVFGLNSRKKLGMICPLGEGPDDFRNVSTSGRQFVKNGNDICLWIGDGYSKYALVNVTASLKEGHTIIIKKYDNMPGIKKWAYGFGIGFMLEDDFILVRTQSEPQYQSGKEYQPTCYHLYKGDMDHHVKDYILYNEAIYSPDKRFGSEMFYNSQDGMRPDMKKIAMGMPLVGQLNILDIETGKLTGYQLKDSYNFEFFASHDMTRYIEYFQWITVDQHYIYASYVNKLITEKEDGSNFLNAKTILVFDWEGNPVITLHLDNKFRSMAFDPVYKMLYLTNTEDELYQYDMNFLYD